MKNILDELAQKYTIDKRIAPDNHGYTKIYFDLLKDKRDEVKKVMEIGIWKGDSLRMWRDYFPFAQIYGLDNRADYLFEADRIKCVLADQRDKESLLAVISDIGEDFDLIVDDGSHTLADQLLSFKTFFPIIKVGGIYAIEDVFVETLDMVKETLKSYNYSIFPSDIIPRNYQNTDISYYYNLVIITK